MLETKATLGLCKSCYRISRTETTNYTHGDEFNLQIIKDKSVSLSTDAKADTGKVFSKSELVGPLSVGVRGVNNLTRL